MVLYNTCMMKGLSMFPDESVREYASLEKGEGAKLTKMLQAIGLSGLRLR